MPLKLEMSAPPASPPSTAYRTRFYTRYAQLKQRTDVEQVRRDLAFTKPYLARTMAKCFPADRNCRIVDLGCGSGALLLSLQEAGYLNTLGVETSPDQVEFARELGVRSVVSGDLLSFLRDSASELFDVVVAFDVIEHFRKDEVLEITDHAYRVLRPGGKLIVHVPNAEGIFGSRIFWSDFTHEMAFTREGLRQLTSACGFGSIEFSEDLPVVHGVKSLIRRVLWTGLRSIFRLAHIAETGDSGAGLILTQNLLAVANKAQVEAASALRSA
jgi:2-polyprenyl-3-methyl-5-hydroxy-6-metoxy-1,4-benzoquinol methylase